MRTSNPTLRESTFQSFGYADASAKQMTIEGTINKTGFLAILALLTAGYVWNIFFTTLGETGNNYAAAAQAVMPWMIGGMIGGLVFMLVTCFKQSWSPVTSVIYVLLEGLFLGGLSAVLEAQFPQIVIQAVALTFGTLICMLLGYKLGVIRVTAKFAAGIMAATGAIALIYLISIVLSFFGMNMPLIHGNGVIGIGFSLFVVTIAALNLVLDFELVNQGAKHGAPKYMEWYAAFGIMVTLVWLYIEILRLLSKLRRD